MRVMNLESFAIPLAFECLDASFTSSHTLCRLYNLHLSIVIFSYIENHYNMASLLFSGLFVGIIERAVEHK